MAVLPQNHIDDQGHLSTSRARALFSLGIALPVLTTFFVGVRLYSRRIKRTKYGMEDWLLVAALIFYYSLTAALYVMVYLAWHGHHTVAVPDPSSALEYTAQVSFYSTLSYAFVATCVRCSTCVLFIRIFIQRSYRYAAFANLGFNTCWGIYSVLITIFQCTPVPKALHNTIPGHCLNQKKLLLSLTIWGVICDAITWALPVPMVWRLHAPLSTKIGLTAILALGLVAIAIGGLRVWTVVTISFEDPLWDLPLATYWAYTETGLGIVCAAGAAIAPAFERFLIRPSKMAYKNLQSWISSRSNLHRSQNTDDTDPLSVSTDELKLGTTGSYRVSIHALKRAHADDARPGEVNMQTEISVTQES